MSAWTQREHPADSSPYVVDFQTGVKNLDYPVGVLCISNLAHQPCVQVIFIGEVDNKVLVAFPGSIWNRTKAHRILPNAWITKATSSEMVACGLLDRETPMEDLTVPTWIGFLKPDLVDRVDFSRTHIEVEYNFEGDCAGPILPFADSLEAVAVEHFSFVSATDPLSALQDEQPAPETVDLESRPAEHGSADMSSRVSRLEETLAGLATNVQLLVSAKSPAKRTPALRKTHTAASPKARVSFAMPSPKHKPSTATSSGEEFPFLDPGVVRASLKAGVSREVLQQMSKLVSRNPRASKVGDINPGLVLDPLSDDDDALGLATDPEDGGAPEDFGDPVTTAVMRLTDILQTMQEEKKKKSQASRLDTALDHVTGGGSSDHGSIGSEKRSAAARRALRSMLVDQPVEIYGMIEKLMWEDISSQTLGPGVSSPAFSVRAWMEHRSRISAFKSAAYGAWGVAGALDCLIQGNAAGARARLAVLMLQFDQASIDQGNWYLAAELGLETGPPFASLEQHKPPSVAMGESPYSRILDGRWAEVALSHLKEQEDFLSKRKGLGKPASTKETEEDSSASPRRRPRPKAKAKAAADPAA